MKRLILYIYVLYGETDVFINCFTDQNFKIINITYIRKNNCSSWSVNDFKRYFSNLNKFTFLICTLCVVSLMTCIKNYYIHIIILQLYSYTLYNYIIIILFIWELLYFQKIIPRVFFTLEQFQWLLLRETRAERELGLLTSTW